MVSAMVENRPCARSSAAPPAASSILAVHPLDTVRSGYPRRRRAIRGAWHCARVTVRREGPLALYKGLAWPLAAQELYQAVMFGVYGAASRALRAATGAAARGTRFRGRRRRWRRQRPGAGARRAGPEPPRSRRGGRRCAPRRAVEIKQELAQGRTFECHAGPARAAAAGGVYRGLGATLLRDVPGVGAYYAAFRAMRRRAVALRGSPKLELAELAVAERGRRRGVLDRGAAAGLREDAPAGRRRGGLGVGRGRAPGRGARGRAPAAIGKLLRARARAGRAVVFSVAGPSRRRWWFVNRQPHCGSLW